MAASSDNEHDSIDGMVLATMKVLDDQVPSGYFEGLPTRTLARLEGSMETTSGSSKTGIDRAAIAATAATADRSAPVAEAAIPQRDEDSGLHDIRNLASSARMRISSRRIGTNPPVIEDDVLSSSSGSWKSIALPEPAKMVSLPDIADLPSKAEIKAREKAEKVAAKASRSSRSSGQIPVDLPLAAAPTTSSPKISSPSIGAGASSPGLAVVPASEPIAPPPMHLEEPALPSFAKGTDKGATSDLAIGTAKGATSAAMPMIGSRIVPQKKNKGVLFGVLGLGVAAAAGLVVYTQVGNKSDNAAAPAAERASANQAEPKPSPTVTAIATDKAEDTKAAAGSAAGSEVKADEPKAEDPPAVVDAPKTPVKGAPIGKKPGKPEPKKIIEVKDPGNGVAPKKEPEKKPDPKDVKKDGEPDLNDLLKEGGYQAPKVDKPKLDKKSLNGADFKNGMNAVRAKAQACFKGTQGTASVKLTVAPSGQVSKVSVTGQFGGKPEGACVEAAVQGASFPPWDGGPQSFNYSYLLAE